MRRIFSVRQVPQREWSSATPLNLRPRFVTLCYLNLGLLMFGLGESLLITSGAGVSPWTVLAQGIAFNTEWSIGFTTMVVSFLILLLWVPLKQKPGIGTILNAIVIAFMIDFSLTWLPSPHFPVWQLMQAGGGVLLVGIASGIYLTANLGAGPRDGLMTGLQARTGLPILRLAGTWAALSAPVPCCSPSEWDPASRLEFCLSENSSSDTGRCPAISEFHPTTAPWLRHFQCQPS
jgi:uncharacterized membrane protein YczE